MYLLEANTLNILDFTSIIRKRKTCNIIEVKVTITLYFHIIGHSSKILRIILATSFSFILFKIKHETFKLNIFYLCMNEWLPCCQCMNTIFKKISICCQKLSKENVMSMLLMRNCVKI